MEQLSPTYDKRIKDSIDEITFEDYVKVVLGDFSSITISKDVTEEEKQTARSVIMAEFADATGDLDYMAYAASQVKLMRLTLKQTGLILAHKILGAAFDPDIFDFLKEQRIVQKNTEYPETLEQLQNVLSLINNEIEFLNIEISESQKKEDKQENGKAELPSKRVFIRLLASVSQFVKFNVTFDTNCAVVAEYISRLREHNQNVEDQKSKSKK